MIQTFASAVAQKAVSESWVTRFINMQSIRLISQYSTGMDANRHNADSFLKYKLYFDLQEAKITQYNVEAEPFEISKQACDWKKVGVLFSYALCGCGVLLQLVVVWRCPIICCEKTALVLPSCEVEVDRYPSHRIRMRFD